MSSVAELVQQVAGTYGISPVQVMTCEVTAVSSGERTCTVSPLTDNLEPFSAQLMADIDDGILILPTIGSTVKIMLSEIITPTVIQYSAIDEILIVSGGAAIKVYSSGVELQGVDYGGMMKVTPSVKAWNDLQNDVNNLKSIFTTIVATPLVTSAVGTPDAFYAAFASNIASYITAPLSITTETQIENTKVKHGGGI
jgi:hypothetical protein